MVPISMAGMKNDWFKYLRVMEATAVANTITKAKIIIPKEVQRLS